MNSVTVVLGETKNQVSPCVGILRQTLAELTKYSVGIDIGLLKATSAV